MARVVLDRVVDAALGVETDVAALFDGVVLDGHVIAATEGGADPVVGAALLYDVANDCEV